MSRQLVYLPGAEFDLAAIYDLIAAESPRAAFDYITDIGRRCEPLPFFPRLGRPIDDGLYRLSFDRRVSIYYGFDDRTLRVSAIRYLGRSL